MLKNQQIIKKRFSIIVFYLNSVPLFHSFNENHINSLEYILLVVIHPYPKNIPSLIISYPSPFCSISKHNFNPH